MPEKTAKNILIVEDYAESARTFQELLVLLGHRVQQVAEGGAAYSLIARENFELVFMDINLPDISGTALLKDFRKSMPEQIANTKFVAFSGYSALDPEGIEASKIFDFYLEKPIDLDQLDRVLGTA